MARSQKEIDSWVKAAGKTANVSSTLLKKIITAGEFIDTNSNETVVDMLKGIDFSADVKLTKLPSGIYVQYINKYKGHWFTKTGLTAENVGIIQGNRTRTLFSPKGSVAALLSKARAIRDTWTKKDICKKKDKDLIDAELKKYLKSYQREIDKLRPQDKNKKIKKVTDTIKARLSEVATGGGIQYFVANPRLMKKIA